MESILELKNDVVKSGSFRLGILNGGKKDQTVVEMGDIDTEKLLVGGERQHVHVHGNSLSFREMKSLTAICDTFLPSISGEDMPEHGGTDEEAVRKFYRTSASMAGTPELIGALAGHRLKHHPKFLLLRLTLWMLSTWFGTLAICGFSSMSSQFPYLHSFPSLSLHQRQAIVLSWSSSFLYPLRMFFKTVKLLTHLVFFTQLDGNDDNLSWKAIGYTGPDPEFKTQGLKRVLYGSSKDEEKEKDGDGDDVEEFHGPLYRGLVNMNYPRDVAAEALRSAGLPASVISRKSHGSTPDILSPSLIIKCDAVVVGSGSGGGVVAGVLAKAGYKVLVLEKGSYCARTNLSLLEGPAMDQMYLSGGLIATEDMGVYILAGSTVGGGSAVNWSASIKTPHHVRKEWCNEYGLELFESKLYREAMDAVCEKMGVQSEINDEGFHNTILRKGCEEMGYPVETIPRNSPPDHYCGWCCLGCKDGKKKGTSETWLVDLVKSGNGAILPGCEAIKVLHRMKGSRRIASGVAFEFGFNGRKDICVVESKVTVVACGALNTPPLLKRSGLQNQHIGRHLHLHPVAMAWGYFPDSASSSSPSSSSDVWPEGRKKSYEGGIMTAMSTVVAEFETSGYGAIIQTPALHPGMFSILIPWMSGVDIRLRMCKFSRTAHIFALARDIGSGIVKTQDKISYKMNKVDEKNLKKGLEKILRILAASGAAEIGTHHCKGQSINLKKESSREFERFVRKESSRPLNDLLTPLCSAHQMGSCRMGTDPMKSVVNPMGETWEMDDLFIADSSVFPTALGVNPMVTVQAIAYCTSQSVLEVLKRKRSR